MNSPLYRYGWRISPDELDLIKPCSERKARRDHERGQSYAVQVERDDQPWPMTLQISPTDRTVIVQVGFDRPLAQGAMAFAEQLDGRLFVNQLTLSEFDEDGYVDVVEVQFVRPDGTGNRHRTDVATRQTEVVDLDGIDVEAPWRWASRFPDFGDYAEIADLARLQVADQGGRSV